MEIEAIRRNFYCWIVLAVFITVTMIFMVNFYNKTVEEIIENSRIIIVNRTEVQEALGD